MFRTFVLTSVILASTAQAQTVHVTLPVNGTGPLSKRIAAGAETACGPLARTTAAIVLVNAVANHAICVRAAVHSARLSLPQTTTIASK